MTSLPQPKRGDTRFALAVGLGFLLLAAIGMAYHELWRDEWQSWLIATQSDSIGELIQRIKDESHTPLWLLCLYAIGKFTDRPEAMQAFHLLIATTSVFVFARYAPFRRWERALFPLGYFMLYEYAIISRHYGLGVLFVVLFCATLRRGNYLLSTTLLAGLAWSSHQGILIAVPLQLMLLLRSNRPISSRGRWMRAGVSCLFLLALIVAVLVAVPPRLAEDHYVHTGADPLLAARSINTVWNAYVPVPLYEDGRVGRSHPVEHQLSGHLQRVGLLEPGGAPGDPVGRSALEPGGHCAAPVARPVARGRPCSRPGSHHHDRLLSYDARDAALLLQRLLRLDAGCGSTAISIWLSWPASGSLATTARPIESRDVKCAGSYPSC